MARSGMTNLINRVRAMTGAGTTEYSAGTLTYWTDDHLQSILDSNNQYIIGSPLTWQLQTTTGGTLVYLTAQALYRDWEEAPGTANDSRLVIRDSTGTAVGTANYTVDYRAGRVTFTTDQDGTAYYITGYSYDVHGAAADVWQERLANFTTWYRFSADNQTFDRQQAWDHAKKMLDFHNGQKGQNILTAISGDLRISQFVRTDL